MRKNSKPKKSSSKFFQHLMKCLHSKKHSHMLYFPNKNDETVFVVKYVDKKSRTWVERDISLFKDCDNVASKVRNKDKYDEECKGRFKANMSKCIGSKRLEQLKEEKTVSVTLKYYKILCDLPRQEIPEKQKEKKELSHEKVGKKIYGSLKNSDSENKVNTSIQNISHFSCLSKSPGLGKTQTEGQEFCVNLNKDNINGNKDGLGDLHQYACTMNTSITEGQEFCVNLNKDGINGNKDGFGDLHQYACTMNTSITEGQEFCVNLNKDRINGNKDGFGDLHQYACTMNTSITEGQEFCVNLNKDGINGNKDRFGDSQQCAYYMIYINNVDEEGRYKVDEEGRYKVDEEGRYKVDEGRFIFPDSQPEYMDNYDVDEEGRYKVDEEGRYKVDEEGRYKVDEEGRYKVDEGRFIFPDSQPEYMDNYDSSQDGVYDKNKMIGSDDPFLPRFIYTEPKRTLVEDHQRSPSIEDNWATEFTDLKNMEECI